MLDHLRLSGRASRTALSAATGLSRATISAVVADLLERGAAVVVPTPDGDEPRVGRTPESLALDPSSGLLLGVDLGHTRVRAVVVDAAHDVVASGARDYPAGSPWGDRLRVAVPLADELLASSGRPAALRGVGVGVTGSTPAAARLGEEVRQALADRYGVPGRAGNNARLAGLAEVVWGAARGACDALYVRLSAGVGGAVVLDGRVRSGPTGSAGELGHVCLDPEGPVCRCGGRGCLEALVGLPVVLAEAGCADVGALRRALDSGDPTAREALRRAATRTAVALAGAVTVMDVPLVVVGGEVADVGEHLLGPLRKELARHVLASSVEAVSVRPAELGEVGGALGGVALLLHDPTVELLAPPAGEGRSAGAAARADEAPRAALPVPTTSRS
ncbi:ROK family protein [Pseudokineococcus sp. 5B2Z-1]|uniref:ROK family protein n=1 Tax=Pseudokineococcus sp. 5B2Z-1 TaxID=3132744 RepID=UPI0030A73FCA